MLIIYKMMELTLSFPMTYINFLSMLNIRKALFNQCLLLFFCLALPCLTLAKQADFNALLQRAEAQRLMGFHKKSLADLLLAAELIKNNNQQQLATVKLSLAQSYFHNQLFEQGDLNLSQGLQMAKDYQRDDLIAFAYNLLGNRHFSEGKTKEYFQQALMHGKKSGDSALIVSILINLSAFELSQDSSKNNQKRIKTTYAYLVQAENLVAKLSSSIEKSTLLIALGYQALQQGFSKLAYNNLSQALLLTSKLKQSRLLSQAQGYLALLYEKKQQADDALELTGQAILSAQQTSASDLLLQWEWQQGRLFKSLQKNKQAIAAYRRAVNHIQAIRQDIPVYYQNGKSSFRETLAPIYMQLVALLIEQSKQQPKAEQQKLLTDALLIVERLKTAEMQDYFKNSCAVEQAPLDDLNQVAPHSAVIYPIIFEDRLEMLLQIGDKKYHHQVLAPLRIIKRLVRRLTNSLHPQVGGYFRTFPQHTAANLYQLMLKPFIKQLEAANIDTLVNAPDGFLRQLPLGALWTGKEYLIEKYAFATVPGLTLMKMKSNSRVNITALLAGVSRPGEVVNDLPEEMQQILASNAPAEQETRSILLRALPAENDKSLAIENIERPLNSRVKDKIQTALQLPGVIDEVEQIAKMLPSNVLLNKDFNIENFTKEISHSYKIVHIASHGLFSGTPEKSFLIAHDQVLNMNKLESFFKSEAFSSSPVEILTLSACQTAEGDDRSPLGLSGVALKSGARSALGSLWPVADVVAKRLLPDFYENLNDQALSKAQALQQAKIKLLKQEQYSHPGLWSSFILIGNWL